jgi:hypothetical protein
MKLESSSISRASAEVLLLEPLQTSRSLWYEHTDCFLEHEKNINA